MDLVILKMMKMMTTMIGGEDKIIIAKKVNAQYAMINNQSTISLNLKIEN